MRNPAVALIFSCLAWLAMAAGCGVYWWSMEQRMAASVAQAHSAINNDVERLSLAVAENLEQILLSTDVALRSLREEYLVAGKNFDRHAQEILNSYPVGMAQFITVFDKDGYLAYSTAGSSEKHYFGDREHFRFHLNNPHDEIFISRPIIGRIANVPLIQITRKIVQDGKFRGVIGFPLRPDFIGRSLSKLDLNPDDLAIIRLDGSFISHSTQSGRLFELKAPPDRPYLSAPGEAHGVLRIISVVTGKPQVIGWRRFKNLPLVAIAGRDEEPYLQKIVAEHNESRRLAAGTIISLLLVSGIGAWLFVRLARRNRDLNVSKNELAGAYVSLEESRSRERLLTAAIEQSTTSIVMTDRHGLMVFVNNALLAETGYQPSELIGQNPRIFKSGKTAPEVYRAIWEALAAGTSWHGELLNQRKDGSLFWESATISPVFDAPGEISHYLAIKENITQRKQLEEDLRESEKRLKQAVEQAMAANLAKDRFLATMSHEIRTPLNGILGMAQLLSAELPEQAEHAHYTRTIFNSGQVLLTLLNDILDFSKIEAGHLKLEEIPISPLTIMEEIAELFGELAHEKNIVIRTAWIGQHSTLLGDPLRLRQMLSNYVGNALKFTESGTVTIHGEEIVAADEGSIIEFSVSDTGIGIPQDKIDKLFQPFTQLDNSTTRSHGGTGLGLSIVKSLAELQGGSAGVEALAGSGSRFWFRIKARQLTSGSIEHQGCDATTPQNQSTQHLQGNILVVEDNRTNMTIICAMLAKLGLTAERAENGLQAVEKLRTGWPADLVLMDLQMPVMDGLTASRQIRDDEQCLGTPRIPIIAITADAYDEDRRRCVEAGMDDFLAKPVIFEYLKAALAKHLGPNKK